MPLKTCFLAVKKVSTQRKIHVLRNNKKTPIFLMCEFSIFYFLLPFPPETDLISNWKNVLFEGGIILQ